MVGITEDYEKNQVPLDDEGFSVNFEPKNAEKEKKVKEFNSLIKKLNEAKNSLVKSCEHYCKNFQRIACCAACTEREVCAIKCQNFIDLSCYDLEFRLKEMEARFESEFVLKNKLTWENVLYCKNNLLHSSIVWKYAKDLDYTYFVYDNNIFLTKTGEMTKYTIDALNNNEGCLCKK